MEKIPEFGSKLRKNIVTVPEVINTCSGIKVFGQLLKSFLFSTDVAIIRNTNANAIIAVYPFTPQPTISQALILAADKPIFCGVGGGITTGNRSVELAVHADFQGALGVVLNKPAPNDLIKRLKDKIDIPVTVTVVSERDDIKGRIDAGVDIFNVSGATKTSDIIKKIRDMNNEVAIIATGGKTEETIANAIAAGANAISYTPPSTGELFKSTMERYRNE
ncbi:hydrolase [Euzebyella marina]|uniref:Hydrolase n=1 Tax=Euzebyella marina TaxID=1761453 RepID=A0A3G2LAZ9_9FLAO|nr:hydrolase [Euzebyella marina]AYN69435.1 hydrolase [Euzebyella marina]MAU71444.1 hydrolase [Pseudozobellia sp.]MBF01629.1 hydrolase [Flavobacterium sp.]MBG46844.1 hydrolase [Pseudozobellia sp.]|tara:strand:- start:1074706 stop:1075365 length:660 start_codon:yes stop_codon:yes gene_type:complete